MNKSEIKIFKISDSELHYSLVVANSAITEHEYIKSTIAFFATVDLLSKMFDKKKEQLVQILHKFNN